jgi:hypothetical protein
MKTIGKRREVFNGNALKTRGGLARKDLKRNRSGKIVSLTKSKMARKEKYNPLMKQNLLVNKGSGVFGVQQMLGNSNKKTKKRRRR